MSRKPYSQFEPDDLILRDHLAIERTRLANERTLLAYLRSGVAMLIAGFTIIHFLQEGWFWAVGIACLPIGVITSIVGSVRFLKMNKKIAVLRSRSEIETGQDVS